MAMNDLEVVEILEAIHRYGYSRMAWESTGMSRAEFYTRMRQLFGGSQTHQKFLSARSIDRRPDGISLNVTLTEFGKGMLWRLGRV